MVEALGKKSTDEAVMEQQASFVELVGPAGAGKTSVAQALVERHSECVEPISLKVRRLWHISVLLSEAPLWLPAILGQYRNYGRLSWQQIKTMVYLAAGHRILRRHAERGKITILDQGPVFKLTGLSGTEPSNIGYKRFAAWRETMLVHWSKALNLVIWLDAPDATLLDRIRTRHKWHTLKEKSDKEAEEFLFRYRRAYENTLSTLMENGGPRVLRFDTGGESLSFIIDKVSAALYLARSDG